MVSLYTMGGILILIVLLILLIGLSLPKEQSIYRNIFVKSTVDDVWSRVADVARQTEWRQDLQKIKLNSTDSNNMAWTEISKNGDEVSYQTTKYEVNRVFEAQLIAPSAYSGTIRIEFSSSHVGTSLRMTETLGIRNPLRRPFSKISKKLESHVNEYQLNLKQYLDA
jgi:hypothetical protein